GDIAAVVIDARPMDYPICDVRCVSFKVSAVIRGLYSFPTRRSSDLNSGVTTGDGASSTTFWCRRCTEHSRSPRETTRPRASASRSEEHTSELQSRSDLVCRLVL